MIQLLSQQPNIKGKQKTSGGSDFRTLQQEATMLHKGLKVLQKEHVFYFSHASAEFWTHLSEITAALPPTTSNIIILKKKLIKIVAAVMAAVRRQLAAVRRQKSTPIILLPPVVIVFFQWVRFWRQQWQSKRLVSHSSFRGADSIFSRYDYKKNRLSLLILKFVVRGLSVDYVKEFNQYCCWFILKVWHRGTHFRRKLTESGRAVCDQKRVQCSLSYGFIKVLQQIRYLVSYLPPSKNIVGLAHPHPPLHSINWREIKGVFLKVWSTDSQYFQSFGSRKVGARGGAL